MEMREPTREEWRDWCWVFEEPERQVRRVEADSWFARLLKPMDANSLLQLNMQAAQMPLAQWQGQSELFNNVWSKLLGGLGGEIGGHR